MNILVIKEIRVKTFNQKKKKKEKKNKNKLIAGVEKKTRLGKYIGRKVLEILRKVRDNKRKQVKGQENSRYQELFALIVC